MEHQTTDYTEALAILRGLSSLLPEVRHLEAVQEYYECELIRMAHEIEQVTKAALQRN